jgi:hypothetical protein
VQTPTTASSPDEPDAPKPGAASPGAVVPGQPESDSASDSVSDASEVPDSEPAPPAGDTPQVKRQRNRAILGAIENEILTNWSKHGTLSVEFVTVFEAIEERKRSKEDRTTGTGKRESMILADGREKLRSTVLHEIRFHHMPGDAPDDETYYVAGAATTKFSDGVFVFTHERNKLGHAVAKTPAAWPHVDFIGGPGLVQILLSLSYLQRLPNEVFDQSECYVFRGVTPDRVVVYDFWIDQATGLRMKLEMRNKILRTRYEATLTKVDVGVEFPEGHFSPKLPEDVEVQDLTLPGAVYRPPGSDPVSTNP